MPQGRKVIKRQAVVGCQRILLANLTKQLRFANAVDPEVSLKVGVEFHNLPWIAGLLHHEVDQKGLQFSRLHPCLRRLHRGWLVGGNGSW